MAPTKITWEEVQSYTRVSSRYNVYENNGQYYFVTEEGGVAPQIVVYSLPEKDYQLLEEGKRSVSDIHFKLQNDRWPPTKEEYDEIRRNSIKRGPITLINNPSSQKLFSKAELEELIPLAEKAWIDWK